MKLTGVGILRWNGDETPVFLGMAVDVSSFGYFQRGAVKEGLHFLTRTIVQRTQPGQRQSVKAEGYLCHVHVRDYGLAGVVIADEEYPTAAAFSIITKVLDEQIKRYGESWKSCNADEETSTAEILDPALVKYQDHTQADKIAKIQKDLDDTKYVLHQTIEGVLKRGEKLDALVDKSNDLSLASQMFYKQARKSNQCCTYM